jgi:hypothetical protein
MGQFLTTRSSRSVAAQGEKVVHSLLFIVYRTVICDVGISALLINASLLRGLRSLYIFQNKMSTTQRKIQKTRAFCQCHCIYA